MSESAETKIDPSINLEKSIKKQRLVYKMTFDFIFNSIFVYAFIIAVIFSGVLILFDKLQGAQAPFWVKLLDSLFLIWLISSLFFRNTFVKIKGINSKENKKNMLETFDAWYEDMDFQVNNEKLLRSYLPTGHPIWGRIITVIFDNDLTLLNITKLGKGHNPTFIHAIPNYLRAKKIAKYFEEKYPIVPS